MTIALRQEPGLLQCFKSTSILRRTPDPYLSSFAIPPHQSFPRFGHFLQLPFAPDRIVVWILHYNCRVSPSRYLVPSARTSVSPSPCGFARSGDFLCYCQRQNKVSWERATDIAIRTEIFASKRGTFSSRFATRLFFPRFQQPVIVLARDIRTVRFNFHLPWRPAS